MPDLYCPYCNSSVPPPPGVHPGQQIVCPRCEEPFRVVGDPFPPRANLSSSPPLPAVTALPATAPRRANQAVALAILGVMGLMAAAGLVLALWTVKERRENDKGLKRGPMSPKRPPQQDLPTPPVQTVSALDLPALRYLPRDTDLLGAVHVAEVLRLGQGRKRLETTFPGLGSVETRLQRIEKLTGLRLKDIDHVVAGARAGGNEALPRLLMVIRTLRPYDAGAIQAALEARKHPLAHGRPLFRFQRELLPLYTQGLLSFPDDRTLVLGWQVANVADMPTAPPDRRQLPESLTDLLAKRGKPAGPVWIAGHSDDWLKALALPLALKLVKVDKPERTTLAKVRSFSVWLEMHGQPTLRGVIRCADGAGAELVKQSLRGRFGKGLVIAQKDEWIDVQVRQPGAIE